LFQAIAHLDLYKRFALPEWGEAINTAHQGLLEPILMEMAARQVALELNTKNWVKGHTEPKKSDHCLSSGAQRSHFW
jgi:histidinol-phosphatase (PHP family)